MRDPLWYKDAIIYQLHVEAFLDRRPALIARRAESPTCSQRCAIEVPPLMR